MRLIQRARELVAIVRQPVSAAKRELLEHRWQELPSSLRTDNQVVGRQLAHCGYTMGASYCSFGCTHCYLPRNANQAPLPTLEEMKEQIDANRRLLGENGALQITGGDVLDAYWKADRVTELVEILRYANDAGTVPMLMTHGQVLLDQPEVFERLVTEGGLRKLAIHIDITQAGRPGYPIKSLSTESDLHPLRQQFVDLIHQTSRRTRQRISAAHTITVTQANASSITEILDWLLEEPRRLQAFGMVSFQTEADIGRTRMSADAVSADDVWKSIEVAAGGQLAQDSLQFGHSRCSSQAVLARLPVQGKLRTLNLLPPGGSTPRFVARLLKVFGGVGSRGNDQIGANVQRLALLARSPSFVLDLLRHLGHVRRSAGLGRLAFARATLVGASTRNLATLNIIQHNFMDAETVRSGDGLTEERLAGCSFRGAAKRNGEWTAVPMCEINSGPREELYALEIQRSSPIGVQHPAN